MLLAAGLGTRLRPYTEATPKPAIPFLGTPLAAYSLRLLQDIQIRHLVVNTHHLPEKVEKLFHKLNWPSDNLIFSNEKNQILGSGGGIRKAFAHLQSTDPFLVMNADEVILPNDPKLISNMITYHKNHNPIATLLTMTHPEVGTKFGGAWVNTNNEIQKFSKTPVPSTKGLHYLGVILIDPRIKKYFDQNPHAEENLLYETLTRAMAEGHKVLCYNCEAQWFETGNPQDFLAATQYCQDEIKKKNPSPWVQYLVEIQNQFGKEKPIIA